MINLLPQKDSEIIGTERTRRTIVVLGIVVVIATLLGIIGLAPSLYSVVNHEHTLSDAEDAVRGQLKLNDIVEARALVDDINRKVAFLSGREQVEILPSEVIERVVAIKPYNISLRAVRYTRTADTKVALVSGTTESRRAIVAFVDALERERSFIEVVSPVSNLLKGSDIEFSIELTLRN